MNYKGFCSSCDHGFYGDNTCQKQLEAAIKGVCFNYELSGIRGIKDRQSIKLILNSRQKTSRLVNSI